MTPPKTEKGDAPKRVQRKRTKGWKMPPNTVYVGRPTKWGNPFKIGRNPMGGVMVYCYTTEEAIQEYNAYLDKLLVNSGISNSDNPFLTQLRGKDLACWCPLNQPCHADVLLELANA